MAKQFFYICAGLLCLVAVRELGVRRAEADFQPLGFVVGTTAALNVWNALGEAYVRLPDSQHWARDARLDLPVPSSEVKLLSGDTSSQVLLVTVTDEVWWNTGAPPWVRMDPVPGSPVPVQGQSFGKTKTQHR